MIIPDDDCFPTITSSNLNKFNNIMIIKVGNSLKGSGDTTHQLATLDRSKGLKGWPADKYINKFLPEVSHSKVNENSNLKKELNMSIDTSAVRPESFRGPLNYKFPSPNTRKKIPERRYGGPINSNSWSEEPWEDNEPVRFDPPKNRPSLLGPCPVTRINPNAPVFMQYPKGYSDFPPRENPIKSVNTYGNQFNGMENSNFLLPLPSHENHQQSLNIHEQNGTCDRMAPLKNFSCVRGTTRKERGSGHQFHGNYSQPPKQQIPRQSSSVEHYNNNFTEMKREKSDSRFMFDDCHNEVPGRSQVPSNVNGGNFQGNFRKPPSYDGKLNNSSGFMGENFQNSNQKSSYQPKNTWQNNRKYAPYRKQNFRGSNNGDFRRKRNVNFSFHKRPWWASPMKNPSNPNKRNGRF